MRTVKNPVAGFLLSMALPFLALNSYGGTACPPIKLDALKKSIDDCIGKDEKKRSRCIVANFTCADAITFSTGLSADVKVLLLFSLHKEQFFVDQRRYHYRELVFDELPDKEYQVGFGYHFAIKQADASADLSGSVRGVAESLDIKEPKTFSFVGIVGVDPLNAQGGVIYKTLSSATAQTSVSDYLNSYTKVDDSFSSMYAKILTMDAGIPDAVAICPQVIAARSLTQGNPAPIDLAGDVKNIGNKVEAALCGVRPGFVRRPNGVFVYAFKSTGANLGQPAADGGAPATTTSVAPSITGDKDQITLKYARRRYFATKDALDLHAEYYADGQKGSFGTGALLSAMFSISGASDTILNSGYAYGYPACMGAIPVNYSNSLGAAPLTQLQGLSNLYATFNSNMNQIDGWALSPSSELGCGVTLEHADGQPGGTAGAVSAVTQQAAEAKLPSADRNDRRSSEAPTR